MRNLSYSSELEVSSLRGYRAGNSRASDADSRSFGSSDSSTSSKNSGNFPPSGRRRSHRPRGCRGGRKNRKSRLAKASALVPKEILDPPTALSPKNERRKNASNEKTDVSRLRNQMSWEQTFDNTSQPSGNNSGLLFMNQGSTGSAFSAPVFSTHSVHPLPSMHKMKQHHGEKSQQLLRPLQNSNIGSPQVGNRFDHQADPTSFMIIKKKVSHHANARIHPGPSPSDILPPPPPPSARPSPDPALQGPNPYALSSFQGTGHAMPMQLGAAAETICTNTFINETCGDLDSTRNPSDPSLATEEIRNKYIQKQVLASGGSLFVTSPRSFLLGRPKRPNPATNSW